MKKLSEKECEEIAGKIEIEGFDYYFNDYGADKKLEALMGDEIEAYTKARDAMIAALKALGVDMDG